MSTKKPSALAVLKNLSPERQAEVWSRLTVKTATWQDTSYAAVRKWLAADGIKTSEASLSDFYSWYPLQQQFRADEVTTESLLEQLKAEIPNLTEEQLDELGQRTFSLLAIRNQDLHGFVTVRSARTHAQLENAKLKLREKKLTQDERKIVLMEKKAAAFDAAKKVTDNKTLTPEEREAEYRRIFGMS
ncbi:MAG: hypothetical protein P4N60_19195 [Verrucomicrobiae bacterium]|nr:hypothetical protein [Verrucomicrobiae bacterium]